MSRAVAIIKALYGRDPRPRKRGLFSRWSRRNQVRETDLRTQELCQARKQLITKKRALWIALAATLIFHAIFCIFYFNHLMTALQDVECAYAVIDSLLQRRHDQSINFSRMVLDYAKHEQQVFKHVSNKRAESQGVKDEAAPDAEGGPGAEAAPLPAEGGGKLGTILGGLLPESLLAAPQLSKILAVAEQYPDLKLSANFQSFMQALVDTEKELSEARKDYAVKVNVYTTRLKTFPGNVFGKVYGFEEIPYLEAEAPAKRLRPVEF